MKKTVGIIMVLILLLSVSTWAVADDAGDDSKEEYETPSNTGQGQNETENSDGNETPEPDGNESDIDEETEEEVEIMNSPLGAEIRLLQLEKAITKNILKGERIIAVLESLGYNTTNLSALLEQLQLVLADVQAANDTVQQFIDLKSDAKNLTKQFRETLKELISDTKLKEIKAQLQNHVYGELQNYSKHIQKRIKQFNRNQINRLYGLIGFTNDTIAEAYQSGNISLAEAKAQLNKMVNKMTKEKKNQMFLEMKKQKINNKYYADEEIDEAVENFEKRKQNRSDNRSEKAKNNSNKAKGKGPK